MKLRRTSVAVVGLAASFASGVAFVVSCGIGPSDSGATAPVEVNPVTQIVKASDADGVTSVTCPTGTVITGGGCDCTLSPPPASRVFSASPVGHSYVCACDAQNVVTAFAICLGTPIRSALTVRDVAADAAVQRLREHLAHASLR